MNAFSYDELAFHLTDSNSSRWFCRIGIGERGPKKSALQKAIKRVQAATWERVNQLLMRYAADKKIENGQKVRTECTAVESNIRHSDDSSLLWDCVRVLIRRMGRARDDLSSGPSALDAARGAASRPSRPT
jgi:transposase, IS5 family